MILPPKSHRKGTSVEKGVNRGRLYLTQKEVADKFRISQSSVKNWREKGLLRYFQAPGSSRVLYPVDAVEELERQSIKQKKEVVKLPEIKRERPRIPTRPETEWRLL